MAVRLGINIASLQTQRRLGEHSQELSKVSERLSSGQRINRASDDAAGLSVSSILQSNSRIYSASIRNINDGISAINIADGALASLSDIATRIAELAEQAANGVYSSKQRVALDKEAQALASEYGRIAEVTAFNGIKLLNGSVDSLDLQVGIDAGIDSRLSINMPSASSRLVGDGTFTADASFATGAGPQGLAVGDLNGDGLLDVVTANYTAGRVSVHLSNGDGTFRHSASYSMTNGVRGVPLLGDFNNDGNLDLVANSADRFHIRLGDGSGNLGAQQTFFTYGTIGYYAAADLNGDQILDIGINGSGGTLNIHLGLGNGTFAAAVSYSSGAGTGGLVFGDMNGDNYLDAIVGSSSESSPLGVMFGNGNGTFNARISYDPNLTFVAPDLADLNGDGHLDVMTSGNGEIRISYGSATGTLSLGPSYILSSGVSNPTPTDVNGDGIIDIVYSDLTNDLVGILIGNSNGTFKAPTTMSSVDPREFALGDMNRDGVTDIIVPSQSGFFGVFYGNGQPAGGLDPFNLLTQSNARAALDYFNDKIKDLAQDRGTLGVGLSRLQVALNNNTTARENTDAAASRILDADIAQDASELIRLQILQRTASKILSEANLEARLVLDLL